MLPSTHLASTQASECLQKFPKQRASRKNAIFSQGDRRAIKIALLPHVLCVPQRTILKADHGKMLHIGKPGPLQYPTPLPGVWPSVDRICAPVWPAPYSSSGAFLDPPGQHLYSIALMIVWLLYKHPSLWLCISYTHQPFQKFPDNFFYFRII